MKNMKLQKKVKMKELSDLLILRMKFFTAKYPELGAVIYDGYEEGITKSLEMGNLRGLRMAAKDILDDLEDLGDKKTQEEFLKLVINRFGKNLVEVVKSN